MKKIRRMLIFPFALLIISFLLSGCSFWWVTRSDFVDEMTYIEKKLDNIENEQKRLANIEKELQNLNEQLQYMSGLGSIGSTTELQEIQKELAELRFLIENTGSDYTQTTMVIKDIYKKFDSSINRSIQALFYEREIKEIKDRLSNLEETQNTVYKDIMERIQQLSLQESNTATSVVSLELFMAEMADIRSRIGQQQYIDSEPSKEIVYIVKPGDTLWDIARTYNLSVEELKAANPEIKENNIIHVGDEIKIPLSLENLLEGEKLLSHFGLEGDFTILVDAIESPFGSYKKGYANPGIDLTIPENTVVTAILPGRVLMAGKINELYGETVIIEHGNGLKSVYARLKKRNVSKGDHVKIGQEIGIVSEGPGNFHFEFWREDIPINPIELIFKNLGEFDATMYSEWDDGRNPTSPAFKMTATGSFAKAYRTVAADPNILPLGSIIYIPFFANAPNKGFFIVEDTGSSVIGRRLDIYTPDLKLAGTFKEKLLVYLVKKP